MNSFMHQQATRPTRLPLAHLLGLGLAVCGRESSDALLGWAKSSIAKDDTKAAIILLKNAVVARDEKHAEAGYQFGRLYLEASDATSTEKELKWTDFFIGARGAGFTETTCQLNLFLALTLL